MPPRETKSLVSRFVSTPLWTAWAVSSSIAIHAVAYVGLGFGNVTVRPKHPKSVVAFEIAPPKLEDVLPEPPNPEPTPPEPSVERARPAAKPAPTPDPSPAPPPAAKPVEPAPVDMSGLTLTNDLGAGFAMPAGNGLTRDGALRVPASLSRERSVTHAVERASVAGPRVVALKDLSSRPTPPALGGALERNYPAEARRRGLGGSAMVRLRIDADGMVRNVTALDESSPGFGEACRRTLRGSRWSAPRDQEGRPVATEVRYTCRFVVNP